MVLSGALARFKGNSVGELLAFVRTVCDRLVGHAAFKKIRERDTLAGEHGDEIRQWVSSELRPDEAIRMVPDCPLDKDDASYLEALFASGSRADLARDQHASPCPTDRYVASSG